MYFVFQETYYIPYRKEGNHKCLAKGKLVPKYYSLRKDFRASGLISNNKDEVDSGTEIEDSGEDKEFRYLVYWRFKHLFIILHLTLHFSFTVLKDVEEKLNFLKDNTEPWDIVLDYWKSTSKARIRMLQASSELPEKKRKFSRAKLGSSNSQNEEFELHKNI